MAGGFGGGVGAACSLALILALAVVVVLLWLAWSMARDRRKAKVEDHIDDLYQAIRKKAVAAAAWDYSRLPEPLFDLLTTLRKELGPMLDLGGPMGRMDEQIEKALNRATKVTSPEHAIPAQGETILRMPNPPIFIRPETKDHPSANSDLAKAARDFSAFWNDEARIKRLMWDTLKRLSGDAF